MFPYASFAVTVTELATPALAGFEKPETTKVEADAGLTVIPVCEPVIVLVTVSVAVIDWVATVFSVTPFVNTCTPLSPATKT